MDVQFGKVDLVVFIGMFGISLCVGIFCAIKDRNKNNVDNYNYGGRNMSPFVVGTSLGVSYISAVTIISTPTEAYLYGTVAAWYIFSEILPKVVVSLYHIPFYLQLKPPTVYKLIEWRFNEVFKKFQVVIRITGNLLYMGFSMYLPALALNAVVPIDLYASIIVVGVICTFYTTLGGMKAVLWTDVIQAFIMFAGALAAMIKTIIDVGGVYQVQQAIQNNNRNNFVDFDPNPFLQRTFWTICIGLAINAFGTASSSQNYVQRYMCCKSAKIATIAVWFSLVPHVICLSIAILTGLAMYAYFQGCDPVRNGEVDRYDQLVPYLVVKLFQDLPGLAGLFVSAAFCGTLSTVSSGINGSGTLILEDFIKPFKPSLNEKQRVTAGKISAICIGAATMGVSCLITLLDGTVTTLVRSLTGGFAGPQTAVFVLALFTPWCNTMGAFIGQIVGMGCTFWIVIASNIYGRSPGSTRLFPLSTDQCDVTDGGNFTTIDHMTSSSVTWSSSTIEPDDKPALYYSLYSLSFALYFTWGFLITFITGLIVSFATGANKASKANPKYFIPLIDNKIFPEKVQTFFRFGVPEYKELENDSIKSETTKL